MHGLTVKGWREELGIDSKEVAEKLGLPLMIYLAKENGKKKWTGSELLDVAKILNISVVDIYI